MERLVPTPRQHERHTTLKRHIHTWKCRHVLEALGRDEETAQADEKACELADKLNKEKS